MPLPSAPLHRMRGVVALLIAAALALVAVAPARAAKLEEGQKAVGLKGTDFLTGAAARSGAVARQARDPAGLRLDLLQFLHGHRAEPDQAAEKIPRGKPGDLQHLSGHLQPPAGHQVLSRLRQGHQPEPAHRRQARHQPRVRRRHPADDDHHRPRRDHPQADRRLHRGGREGDRRRHREAAQRDAGGRERRARSGARSPSRSSSPRVSRRPPRTGSRWSGTPAAPARATSR